MVIELQTPFLRHWRNLNKIAASYGLQEWTHGEALESFRIANATDTLVHIPFNSFEDIVDLA